MSTQPRRKPSSSVPLLLLLIVFGCGGIWLYGYLSAPTTAGPSPTGALIVCEDQVRNRLRSPSTAEFPSSTDVAIRQAGNTFTVDGYVDAENAFGAAVRTTYTCTATYTGDDTYRVQVAID